MPPVIYADLRCLQDICYQRRGIGYHTAALLRARSLSSLQPWKMVGLIDPSLPALPPDLSPLVDELSLSLNPQITSDPAIFLDGSPMTHDTRFALRLLNHPGVLKAAVLYDFIPLDWPGYLPTVAKRIEYSAKIARLCKFNLFFPISSYTAWRLAELTGISGDRVKVTGASVRQSLYDALHEAPAFPSPYSKNEPYFVTLGGDDRRKNTDVAVNAVRRLNLVYGRRIPLKVIGHYGAGYKEDLLRLAGHPDGRGFLEFYPNISDRAVVELHGTAVAAICPSRIEGFSLPVTEAAICGCPVISSTCAAQLELVTQPEALFHSEDYLELSAKLENVLNAPALREALVAQQSHLAKDFHADQVGRRLWQTLESSVAALGQARRGSKLRLAFLTPASPSLSEASKETMSMASTAPDLFEADLFTGMRGPLTLQDRFIAAAPISVAPLLDGRYDVVISVLSNEVGCSKILDFFRRQGGPCLLQDLRLNEPFLQLLGHDGLRELARQLSHTPDLPLDVPTWMRRASNVRLLLKELVDRAQPVMVQTPAQRAILREWFGIEAQVVTCCPTILLQDEQLSEAARQSSRSRLNIADDQFAIASFENSTGSSAVEISVLSLELLRAWGIPAELHFAGDVSAFELAINHLTTLYPVADYIHFGQQATKANLQRDLLVGADAALHLRDYSFGSASRIAISAICAGLPSVATADIAEACEAPFYVRTVPDRFSPLQVAEQLALVWESRCDRSCHEEARQSYLRTHNYTYYAQRVLEILQSQ